MTNHQHSMWSRLPFSQSEPDFSLRREVGILAPRSFLSFCSCLSHGNVLYCSLRSFIQRLFLGLPEMVQQSLLFFMKRYVTVYLSFLVRSLPNFAKPSPSFGRSFVRSTNVDIWILDTLLSVSTCIQKNTF